MMRRPQLLSAAIIFVLHTGIAIAAPRSEALQGVASDGKTHISLWNTFDDAYTSSDTVFLGGVIKGAGAHIIARCQPTGFYDTGACLDLQMTDQPWTSSRPGINSGFEQGLAAIAADPDMDSVNEYNGVGTLPPVLTLQNVTYTATKIIPATPLTAAQIALVVPSMWVLTNSIDTSVANSHCAKCVATLNVYGSTVTGVAADGSSIAVAGWTVPGSGHAMTGQVPSSKLDRGKSYRTSTAFLGATTNAFNRNTVISFDPNNPANVGWQTTNFQADEIDVFDYDTLDYRMQFQGITVAFREIGVVPAANGVPAHSVQPSADSYDMDLAGPTPTLLKMDGLPTANYIVGNSILVRGNGGVAATVGNRALMFENDAFTGGASNMRLEAYLLNDSGAIGYSGTSLHYGLTVDGTQGVVNRPQSQIVFDAPDTGTGGISLWGFNSKGIAVNASGLTTAENGLSVSGTITAGAVSTTANVTASKGFINQIASGTAGSRFGTDKAGDAIIGSDISGARLASSLPVTLPSYTYANLPAPGHAGSEVFCTNCLKPNEPSGTGTGMIVFDDGDLRWTSTAGTIAAH